MVTEEIRKKIVVETEMRDKIKSRLDALNAQFQKLSNTLKKNKQQLSALNLKIQGGGRGPKDIEKWKNSMLKLKRINHGLNQSMDLVRHKIDLQADGMRNSTREIRQLEMSGKKLAKQQQQVGRFFSSNSKEMARNMEIAQQLVQTNNTFGKVQSMTNKQFELAQPLIMKQGNKMQKLSSRVRMATRGFRGFRMEMLGVMFFGMAMSRMFTGMLRPAAEMLGFFEIWTIILQTLFLPIMLELLPYLLDLMNWVLEMSPAGKKVIGVFVLIGAAVGILLQTIGMLALGLGSLFGTGTFVTGVTNALTWIGKLFTGLLTGATAVVAIVIAIIIGMWVAWRDNLANMRNWVAMIWEGVKNIFGGLVNFFIGILNIIYGVFTLNWSMIKQGFFQAINGIKQYFFGLLQFVTGIIVSIGIGVATVVKWLWDKLKGLADTLFGDAFDWGVQMIIKLAAGIASKYQVVMDAILSLFPKWARNAIWKFGTFSLKIMTRGGGISTGEYDNTANDFLSRPGEGLTKINPNDTVVGFKGDSPFGKSVNITQNITITGSLKEEIERAIKDNNTRLMDDIKKAVGI